MENSSTLNAVVNAKCPRCHQGNLWTYPFLQVRKFNVMNKNCPHCDIHFEVEPGFFYGAMYISYGITALVALALGTLILHYLPNASDLMYAFAISVVLLVIFPFTFRAARTVYLYLFSGIDYQPDATIKIE